MEDRFCEKCDCELAEYKYNGKAYCHECLLDKLEEDKKIQSWSTTHYITEDTAEYLGNDNDNSYDEIIENLQKRYGIKSLED